LARPRLLAELRGEHAQRDGHLHGGALHAPGHVADGDAVAEGALGAEVVHHAAPLQLRHLVLLAAVGGRGDLVRQHRARRDLGLAGLHVLEVLGEALLVVLLEEGLVAAHGHRGDAGVGQLVPPLRAHVDLRELQGLADRHEHLAAEAAEDAVAVVLVRELGVLGVGVAREEAAGDGLAEQRGAVEGGARRGAPLGGQPDLPLLAAEGHLLHVGGEQGGEEVGHGVEQEAVGAVAVVGLERLHGELGHGPDLLRHAPLGGLLLIDLHGLGLLLRHGRRLRDDGPGSGLAGALAAGEPDAEADPLLGELLALPARLVGGGALLGEPAHVLAADEAEEQLGEVLEIPKLGERGDVAGERARVVVVQPERGGIEALPVRLAGAAHAAEVAGEPERRERVAGPGGGEEIAHARGGRGRDHVEEEVDARVARVGVRGVAVLRARPPRGQRRLGLGGGGRVEGRVEEVEERVRLRGVVGGVGRGARRADQRRAQEEARRGCG
uniref:Uncharacterized protein n=1 Tax=Triticum urartu TaxID=4572 RepID=A0A8R7V828_TRIUA